MQHGRWVRTGCWRAAACRPSDSSSSSSSHVELDVEKVPQAKQEAQVQSLAPAALLLCRRCSRQGASWRRQFQGRRRRRQQAGGRHSPAGAALRVYGGSNCSPCYPQPTCALPGRCLGHSRGHAAARRAQAAGSCGPQQCRIGIHMALQPRCQRLGGSTEHRKRCRPACRGAHCSGPRAGDGQHGGDLCCEGNRSGCCRHRKGPVMSPSRRPPPPPPRRRRWPAWMQMWLYRVSHS